MESMLLTARVSGLGCRQFLLQLCFDTWRSKLRLWLV